MEVNKQKQYKDSIIKKTIIIYAFVALMVVAFVLTMIITLSIYSKVNSTSSKAFSDVAQVYSDVMELDVAVRLYNDTRVEVYENKVMEAYEQARTTISEIFTGRYRYSQEVRSSVGYVQDMFEPVKVEISNVASMTEEERQAENVLVPLMEAVSKVRDAANDALTCCDSSYREAVRNGEMHMKIVVAIMSLILCGFLAIAIIAVIYLRKKVAKPIAEVAEWALLFNDGYGEMADMPVVKDDNEIASLARSFNHVRVTLLEANRLKAENALALQKLHNEEAYHKKFVQKFHEEKREKDDISAKAKRDGLTGLYNRRSFDDLVEEFLKNHPANALGALYLIDMDFFKNVNDTLGHIAGDEALKQLSGAMSVVFPGAYLGRYGGDEFVVFMTTGNEDLFRIKANELCHKMDKQFIFGDNSVHISVSVGVASTEGVHDYSELYMIVDRALYYAKEHGRNQYKMAKDLED